MTTTTDGWDPEKIIDLYAQVVKDVDAVGAGWIKVTRANGRLQFDRIEHERVKREWVELTDKEIRALAKRPNDIEIPMTGRMWIFVGELMRKLEEKNT